MCPPLWTSLLVATHDDIENRSVMCVQYRGGGGGVLSTMGVFSTVGVGMGDVQYRGGMFTTVRKYHDTCGGYHEYREVCSVSWGIS